MEKDQAPTHDYADYHGSINGHPREKGFETLLKTVKRQVARKYDRIRQCYRESDCNH